MPLAFVFVMMAAIGAFLSIALWMLAAIFTAALLATSSLAAVPFVRALAVAASSALGLFGYVIVAGLWILPLQTGAAAALTFVVAVIVPPLVAGRLFAWVAAPPQSAERARTPVWLDLNGRCLSERELTLLLDEEERALALEIRSIRLERARVLATHERVSLDHLRALLAPPSRPAIGAVASPTPSSNPGD